MALFLGSNVFAQPEVAANAMTFVSGITSSWRPLPLISHSTSQLGPPPQQLAVN